MAPPAITITPTVQAETLHLLELLRERDTLQSHVRDLEKDAPAERMLRSLGWDYDELDGLYKRSRLIWNEQLLYAALETMLPSEVYEATAIAERFLDGQAQIMAQLKAHSASNLLERSNWIDGVVAPQVWSLLSAEVVELASLGVPRDLVDGWISDMSHSYPAVKIVKERYWNSHSYTERR